MHIETRAMLDTPDIYTRVAGYAMEELVAELGAAFVCADLGIAPEPREETAACLARAPVRVRRVAVWE
jgi:antirestriction protein ArdC